MNTEIPHKLSKAERKKRAQEKRMKIAQEIYTAIRKTYKETKDWEKACKAGDREVMIIIDRRPQEASLVRQAANIVITAIEKGIDKYI